VGWWTQASKVRELPAPAAMRKRQKRDSHLNREKRTRKKSTDAIPKQFALDMYWIRSWPIARPCKEERGGREYSSPIQSNENGISDPSHLGSWRLSERLPNDTLLSRFRRESAHLRNGERGKKKTRGWSEAGKNDPHCPQDRGGKETIRDSYILSHQGSGKLMWKWSERKKKKKKREKKKKKKKKKEKKKKKKKKKKKRKKKKKKKKKKTKEEKKEGSAGRREKKNVWLVKRRISRRGRRGGRKGSVSRSRRERRGGA